MYEQELVEDLRMKLQEDKNKDLKRREDMKVLAAEMIEANETNKSLKTQTKMTMKALDVRLCKEYIERVDEQERKKREEIERRETKVKTFMGIMEK